jgi:hypothetical protein
MTACTGTATTVTTTTQTATTIIDECAPSSCGRACAVKRGSGVIQTAVPYAKPATLEDSFDSNNTLVLNGRDIPGPGSGNWGQWYDNLKNAGGTITIDNDNGDGGSNTAVAAITWGDKPAAIVVQELKGCIAVLCYSLVGKSIHASTIPSEVVYTSLDNHNGGVVPLRSN